MITVKPGRARTRRQKGEETRILGKDREERKIPNMPALRKILDSCMLGPDGNELPCDAHVFGSETGDEMHRRHLCTLWMKTCERAKVKNLHPHDLRGEAGSQLLEAGVPIHEMRDALGHSSTTDDEHLSANAFKQLGEGRISVTCIARGRRCDWPNRRMAESLRCRRIALSEFVG